MEQYTLTHPEAEIISTIRNDDEATIYEITTATRLTPSEALEALNQLRERNLVRLIENDRIAQLTDEGRRVRMLIDRQGRQPFSAGSGQSPVIIISDEVTKRASRKVFEELEPEELDLALDSEIQTLELEQDASMSH